MDDRQLPDSSIVRVVIGPRACGDRRPGHRERSRFGRPRPGCQQSEVGLPRVNYGVDAPPVIAGFMAAGTLGTVFLFLTAFASAR
jgi:hypothetical protein